MRLFHLITLTTILVLTTWSCSRAQNQNTYKNENWNPEKGQYYFSEQWTWAYTNDFIEGDSILQAGEITIYVDSLSGTLLFTKEAYGASGEMVDFVIADQSGLFTFGYTDEHGSQFQEKYLSDKIVDILSNQNLVQSNFKTYATKTGNTKIFNTKYEGQKKIVGEEYIMTSEMSTDVSHLHIVLDHSFGILPLYYFNTLDNETKLPTNINNGMVLPVNTILLSDVFTLGEKTSSFTLVSITPTEYFVDLSTYAKLK